MNHFLTLAVAAVCLSLVLAQDDHDDHPDTNKKTGDGYYGGPYGGRPRFGGPYGGSHGGRFGGPHGGRYGGSHGGRFSGGYGHGGYGYYKKCSDLEDPENGDVKVFGFTPGSRAVYYCTLGFNLVGKKTRVCQRDGTWSGVAPICEPVDCGHPEPAGENSALEVGEKTLKNTATYTCDEGYLIDVTQGGSAVVICLPSGVWSDSPPVCIPVDCGNPPEEDVNGELEVGETTLNEQATYTCNAGFQLPNGVPEVVLTCTSSGSWSPPNAPPCTPVDCGSPPTPSSDGTVDVGATTYRSTAVYSCNSGYLLDDSSGGSQQIECLETGVWSDTVAPACARIDCGYISVPLNGAIKYNTDTRLDSQAVFSCERGFNRVGAEIRVCLASGDWSLSSPTCERIICPKLSPPEFGKVTTFSNFVDGKSRYACSYGFKLVGDKERVCQENGTWTGSDPTCNKIQKYGYGHGGRYGGGYGHGNAGY